MRRLIPFSILVVAAVSFVAFRPAARMDASSVAGVWKTVSVTILGGPQGGTELEMAQPSLSIFTERHFATVFVVGMQPRATLAEDATEEQLLAAWAPFQALAGTFELSGDELRTKLIVSKSPNETAEQKEETSIFEVDGDTLYRTFMDEWGNPALKVKFVRVE